MRTKLVIAAIVLATSVARAEYFIRSIGPNADHTATVVSVDIERAALEQDVRLKAIQLAPVKGLTIDSVSFANTADLTRLDVTVDFSGKAFGHEVRDHVSTTIAVQIESPTVIRIELVVSEKTRIVLSRTSPPDGIRLKSLALGAIDGDWIPATVTIE